jgi:hypothetical protein
MVGSRLILGGKLSKGTYVASFRKDLATSTVVSLYHQMEEIGTKNEKQSIIEVYKPVRVHQIRQEGTCLVKIV